MNDQMNDELRKMIEKEASLMDSARSITILYNGLIDCGLPKEVAIDLIKFIISRPLPC